MNCGLFCCFHKTFQQTAFLSIYLVKNKHQNPFKRKFFSHSMGEFYQKLTAEVAEKTPDKDVDRTSPSALELDALKPQLHKELNHIRKLCDKHLPKQEAREMDEYENENYPLGCCGHITPWFIDMMPAFAECSPEKYPALARTLEIAQPFKRLYGIQSSKFFCNGIQLGTIFIDPAADSVKGATEQVII